MRIEVIDAPLDNVESDVLVVGQWEGLPFEGAAAEVDRLLGGALSEAAGFAEAADLTGKKGELNVFFTRGALRAPRVAVVGLGDLKSASPTLLREEMGSAVRKLRDRKVKTIATTLHHLLDNPAESAEAVVEGALIGEWDGGTYKASASRPAPIERLMVLGSNSESGAQRGEVLGESVNLARYLVNEPGNELFPEKLAERAAEMAREVGLGCEILGEETMRELGMGGMLAVSAGSDRPAWLVVLKHTPNPGGPAIALVGKGITFDTGGISIKAREGMEHMKGDMAGSAAVIGAMRAIALLKVPVNVVGVLACAENMPGGNACRPGDVVRFMNGKTAEIISTDAEGRMVLGDALTYAVRNLGAEAVVDVATLTGACVIALGQVATGAFSGDAELMARINAAAGLAGEKVWEMPMYPEYRDLIKSEIADMKNSGGRTAGAITGAMFLEEFVEDKPWVHLDIAGTGGTESPPSHMAKGPTGAMVRTFVRLVESFKDDERRMTDDG